jgi:hypothetical protein
MPPPDLLNAHTASPCAAQLKGMVTASDVVRLTLEEEESP